MDLRSIPIAAALCLACLVASPAPAQTRPDACALMRQLYPEGTQKHAPAALGDMRIGNMRPVEGFRLLSGYYCDWPSNLPTIYAHSSSKVTVVGYGYEQEFDMRDLDKALDAWRALLARQLYPVPPR